MRPKYFFAIYIRYPFDMLTARPIALAFSLWVALVAVALFVFKGYRASNRYLIHVLWRERRKAWHAKLFLRQARLRKIEAEAALAAALEEAGRY